MIPKILYLQFMNKTCRNFANIVNDKIFAFYQKVLGRSVSERYLSHRR